MSALALRESTMASACYNGVTSIFKNAKLSAVLRSHISRKKAPESILLSGAFFAVRGIAFSRTVWALSDIFQLIKARAANALALEGLVVLGVAAKQACGLVLFQNDPVVFGINFDIILQVDVQGASDLNRKHKAPQLIDLTCHSGRFHSVSSFLFFYSGFSTRTYSIICRSLFVKQFFGNLWNINILW